MTQCHPFTAPSDEYQWMVLSSFELPLTSHSHVSGRYTSVTTCSNSPDSTRLEIEHIGAKLSGYASMATTMTAAQKPALPDWRSSMR
jgi:hypothetical protein